LARRSILAQDDKISNQLRHRALLVVLFRFEDIAGYPDLISAQNKTSQTRLESRAKSFMAKIRSWRHRENSLQQH
jgi:hypothetical protein